MALESGTKLGHYEITDQIGKGGMGEVYRARDTKLGREVAIKVLPSEFSQDAERLTRLEREARLLASLNHPNIASIHGLEQSDDTRLLVLELVEGDTLADRLKRGAIPVEESLKLALQIAEAVEAAHEKGVIHRDLKPANIKITPEGRVKVLDFGLAKAFTGDQADVNLSNSPTLSMQATEAGIVLGTAAYMSPEQAEGETADSRSDVWSFGVILFEMLTGRQTFDGKSVARVLAAVLNSEPHWTSLPSNLHPRVRALLDRLLEKDRKDRLSSISDARVEIQRILADPLGVVVHLETGSSARQSSWRWAAAAILVGALAGLGGWFLKPAPLVQRLVSRSDYELPEGVAFKNSGSTYDRSMNWTHVWSQAPRATSRTRSSRRIASGSVSGGGTARSSDSPSAEGRRSRSLQDLWVIHTASAGVRTRGYCSSRTVTSTAWRPTAGLRNSSSKPRTENSSLNLTVCPTGESCTRPPRATIGIRLGSSCNRSTRRANGMSSGTAWTPDMSRPDI
jgi:serine/threonine protein kinase